MSSPEPMHNRITNAEDKKVKPVFCQTDCCTKPTVVKQALFH